MNVLESKTCTRCKKDYKHPNKHFYKNNKNKCGLGSWCKTCFAAWRQTPRAKALEKIYRKNRKLKADYNEKNRARTQTVGGKYSQYKRRAKQRGFLFNITKETFNFFWQKPCYYCGDEIKTIGLDRIDNEKGYTKDNIVACCKHCNLAKRAQTPKEYIDRCRAVSTTHPILHNLKLVIDN